MNTAVEVADVGRFREVLARRLGLSLQEMPGRLLADVLAGRVAAHGGSCAAYLDRLSAAPPPGEIGALAQDLTVSETYFFRHVEQFRAVAEVVLPERMRVRAAERALRLLSVGCASGEEAYTLAMVVRECVPEPAWDVSIVGIDISPPVLRKAERARYSAWALRATPTVMQQRWFRSDGAEVVLDEEIRRSVRFVERNLVDADPKLWRPDTYDVVFCRNVLMYLTPEAMQAVVTRTTRALAPGGFFFLGHAETLRGLSHDVALRQTNGTFYYRRRSPDDVTDPPAPANGPAWAIGMSTPTDGPPTPTDGAGGPEPGDWVAAIGAASGRIRALAEAHGPPGSYAASAPVAASAPDWDKVLDLLRAERFGEALGMVEAAAPHPDRQPDILILHAVLLFHNGRLDRAEEVCRRLLDLDGLDAGARYLLAWCREGDGDRRAAVAHYRAAAYLDPGFALPRLRLGLLARKRGELDAARRELGHALALLSREEAHRLLLFGGGFTRPALIALCEAELVACGSPR